MIISYKCTAKEAQVILGMDIGDPTCTFRFPCEEEGTDDHYRIHIYAADYSAYPHGNPIQDIQLPPDAWAFRVTKGLTQCPGLSYAFIYKLIAVCWGWRRCDPIRNAALHNVGRHCAQAD